MSNNGGIPILNFQRLITLNNEPVFVFASDTDSVTYGVTLENLAIAIAPFISGTSVWGGITGTLSNQTDLTNALLTKLNLTGGTLSGLLAGTTFTGTSFNGVALNAAGINTLFLDQTGSYSIPPFTPTTGGSALNFLNETGVYSVPPKNPFPANLIIINEEANFPTQTGSTITLDAGKNFLLGASFSTSKRFIVEQGSNFTANNFTTPVLTYTGTGVMFTSSDAQFTMDKIKFDAPNASRGYDCTDTTGNTKGVNLTDVFFDNLAEWGTFDSLLSLVMSNNVILASTGKGGVTVSGSGWFAFTNMGFSVLSSSSSFIATDLGTSVHRFLNLDSYVCIAPSGGIGIKGLANSANMLSGSLATITNTAFIGGMTVFLSGLADDDIRFDYDKNANIRNTMNSVDMFLQGGVETIPVASSGDWIEIGVPSGGGISWGSDIASRFTVSSAGVITYTGERSIDIVMNGRATVEKAGGGADVIEVRIAKNWDGLVTDGGLAKTGAQTQNANPTTVPIGGLTQLVAGDDIRVIFSNISGTADIEATVASLELNG